MINLDFVLLNYLLDIDDIIVLIEKSISKYKNDNNKESFDDLSFACGLLIGKKQIERRGIENVIKEYESHVKNEEIKKIEKKQKQ